MTRQSRINSQAGSALLGAELRRLRGLRTLDEIAALSAAPPLAGSVPPISASTISDLETAQQLDLAFEASLGLFQLLREDSPQAAVLHFQRCKEILPLLPGGSPAVQAFEHLAREAAG